MSTSSRRSLVGWLVGHTRRLVPVLGIAAMARIASQLAGVALLVIAARAVVSVARIGDASTGSPSHPQLLALGLTMAGVALAKAVLRYLEQYCGHWVAFGCLQRLRELFFSRLVPQAPAATTGRAGAELTERATRDIDRIEVFFAHTLPPAVSAVLVPVLALAWLAGTSGVLALTLAASVLVVLVVPVIGASLSWRAARRVAAGRGEVAAQLGDDLQGVREVLALNAGPARMASLEAADRRLGSLRGRSGALAGVRAGIIAAVQPAGLVAVVVVTPLCGAGWESMLTALAVGIGLWTPARGIDDFVQGLDDSLAAAERVREVIDATPLVVDPDSLVGGGQDPRIVLDRVSFGYPGGGRTALDDVCLTAEPGSWTRVVGVSGSGKSTLAGLLLRGWDVDSGSVRLGGVDVSAMSLDELRSRVAMVPQHPVLFSGSLADNLRLARPEADARLLERALAAVCLEDWAAGLPQGLDTPMTGRGSGVSGGQLQRIAIARGLVAGPEVLVLDEALSQLDAPTAERVRAGVARWRRGMTVLEITHRVDLVPDDSPVIVLDAGRMVEQGMAGRLRAGDGPLSRLVARG
ncbi:ABC transporter ATP-binding protein [Acidipropionibacterium jensenii]|uniref:ABC transporter ATP-binding protein n=1 Tax=Acidipropionibacterium jensenii TaxID=1749 RepID=UPI0026492E08|nr:ABC transporter ATP-binding protein [Acidipropionibacterium jensenii]MDN6593423.1 ABC transporter ATP-binding protein/permease [Acidipropionibacterium jensenii]